MVVREDGGFTLSSYDKSLDAVVTLPTVPTGDFRKEKRVVCPGVNGYSTSIGYDLKSVTTTSWPPDTARDC